MATSIANGVDSPIRMKYRPVRADIPGVFLLWFHPGVAIKKLSVIPIAVPNHGFPLEIKLGNIGIGVYADVPVVLESCIPFLCIHPLHAWKARSLH